MDHSKKLDQILAVLNKQQMDNYIPAKWKPYIEYLENTGREPLQMLEAIIKLDEIWKARDERLKKKEVSLDRIVPNMNTL